MKKLLLLLLCTAFLLCACSDEKKNGTLAYQDGDFSFVGSFRLDGMEYKARFTQTKTADGIVRTLTYLEPTVLSGFSFRQEGEKVYASYAEHEVELSDATAALQIFSLLDIPQTAQIAGTDQRDGVTETVLSTDAGTYTLRFADGDPIPLSIVFTGHDFGMSLRIEK
ncbi:MAG: hypothetical protein IJW71_06075 [Clostridia bacterium]|nr:hypothetical protein [Clostridia bacterium]